MDNILRRLDLNLLVTLDALLAEHNVTRAAQKLHLAQPTVSLQLARLRDVFSAPLLLPGPRGMRPTARADALREPLRLALESLAHAVSPARLDLQRRVALSVPHFLFLAAVLAHTDLVTMAPERLVRGNPALCVVEAPVEVPGFQMLMLWPERVHRDPAHQWLRDHIAQACASRKGEKGRRGTAPDA